MLSGLAPPRVGRGMGVLVALGAAFFGIARTTGAGWVVVLLCSLVGCLAVALVAPLVSLSRARVAVVAPRDATVGQPAVLELSVPSGVWGTKVRSVVPPGDWVAADPPAAGDIIVTPAKRGVLDGVELEVEGGSPLGLARWRRRLRAPLRTPMEVGPRPVGAGVEGLDRASVAGGVTELRGRLGHDSVRGVREYAAGDPIRVVHWPATARWGRLMVKELEDPDLPWLTIVVDLRGEADRAEDVASRAAGLLADALGKGLRVTLVTAERAGGVAGEVASPLEGGRRLARAVSAAPPEGPWPEGSMVVRLSAWPGGQAVS